MTLLTRRYRNYFWLVPLFVIALLYQITYTVVTCQLALDPSRRVEVPFAMLNGVVAAVDSTSSKAGLAKGDRIIAVDGHEIRGDRDFYAAWKAHRRDSPILLQVAGTHGAVRTIGIPRTAKTERPSLKDSAITAIFLAISLLCVVTGIYVAAVLPNDARALSFFGLMLGIAGVVANAQWFDFPSWAQFFGYTFFFARGLAWPIALVCFALYFPERFGWDVKRPWIKVAVLAPLSTFFVLLWADNLPSYYTYAAVPLRTLPNYGLATISIAMAAAISFFFAAIGFKTGRVQSRDSRRRLRILLYGSLVAFTPLGLLVAYAAFSQRPIQELPEWPVITCALIFCLFPITVAYVVVVDRAMDLRVVIRQGVRYTLAKGGLRVLLGLIAAGILLALSRFLFGSGMRRLGPTMDRDLEIGIFSAAVLLVVYFVRKTKNRLMSWVDRKFFREAYNSQKILEQLSESVHGMVDEDKMLDTVARQISESMHVPQFAVLMNQGKEFRPVYCLGFERKPDVALAEDSRTVEVVKEAKDGARVNFEREDNWVHSAPETELVTLKAIHAQLLLPLSAKDKLLGILSLGQKLSEEPYSPSDVQMLRSVSVQTALALENSRLTKAVATEIAQREKLNREIEIAREVQERLFPQRLPVITGIDYYGACRPALGVGGDYYDFLALPNGDLGIAIGDVSGKGIAAALLMASLQASLRGQALVGQGDLAQLMANVNQLVYDATPTNRYATFFYGQFQWRNRVFRYVNAGHNAPIVLRRTGDNTIHVIRLDTGGPVVGLFPKAPYQEGVLTLEPGDIFVGFTDGVSEAMNKEDEEWGEERLIPAVAAHSSECAAEIIPKLMAEADRFVAGAPQHDDMTLVVMKLSEDGELNAQAKIISSAR